MTTTRPRTLVRPLLAVATGALVLAGCAAGEVSGGSSSSDGSGGEGRTIVVGGANFTEALVMESMYSQLLDDAGYTTEEVTADSREIYYPQLAKGDINVVPDYAATLAEFLNAKENGEGAPPIATNDVTTTIEAAEPFLETDGVALLEPAEAVSGNGFAVTEEFAQQNDLETLSDLAALGQPLVIAATEECPGRPFCQAGLESVYGLTFTRSLPTGFSSPQTKAAVQSGEAQLALVGTTDATIEQFGLVVLEDDEKFQAADNVTPLVTAELAEDTELVETLDSLSAVLTTEDLKSLNEQVDSQRMLPADVARAYLEDKGLIGG